MAGPIFRQNSVARDRVRPFFNGLLRLEPLKTVCAEILRAHGFRSRWVGGVAIVHLLWELLFRQDDLSPLSFLGDLIAADAPKSRASKHIVSGKFAADSPYVIVRH